MTTRKSSLFSIGEGNDSFPALKESLLCGIGIFLAVYTVLLKLAALPCVSGDCHRVIHSSYGTFMGLPVGLYSLVLWSILLTLPGWPSRVAKILLALGAVYFLIIQAFVLNMFCPICGTHALVSFLAVMLSDNRRRSALFGFIGVIAAFCFIVWSGHQARGRLQEQLLHDGVEAPLLLPVREAEVSVSFSSGEVGLPWLSRETLSDTHLVISFTCSQCLSVLESFLAGSKKSQPIATLLLKVDSDNRAITETFLAAVLSRSDLSQQVAFSRAFGLLIGDKDVFFRNDGDTAAFLLIEEFPTLNNFKNKAETLLDQHAVLIELMGVYQTPSVLKKGEVLAYSESLILQP